MLTLCTGVSRMTTTRLVSSRACRRAFAGTWLTALPIPSLGLKMSHRAFAACVRFRLGMPLYSFNSALPIECPECHKNVLDRWGHHSVICKFSNDRNSRHNQVRDVVHNFAVQGGLSCQKEVKHLLAHHQDGAIGQKPADILIHDYKHGKALCADITVVSPLQQQHMHQEVRQRGQHAVALSDAEEKKFAKYEDKCREAGLLFTPLAFEVFGGHGNHCRQLLSRLADACAIRNNYPRSITKCRLRQLISIAIQRGNATALLRRDPREYALPGAY